MTTVARLRALVTVADTGSVRQAARRLTVTESAVSSALSALAREVRVPLVERDGRGLRLTAAGQAYSRYARAILGLHEEGLAAARADRDPERRPGRGAGCGWPRSAPRGSTYCPPCSRRFLPVTPPSTSGWRWAAANGCGACSARTRPTWSSAAGRHDTSATP